MKGKIGMEKLIELFKDYVENYGNDTKDPTIDYAVIYDGQGFYVGARFYSDEKVLSKNFGFIKWLVENDKIDLDKLEKKVLKENLIRKFDEGLLMLLAISSSPIDDLISYLR